MTAAERVGDRAMRSVQRAEQLGGAHVRARDGNVTLLDHVPLLASAGPAKEPSARKFSNMVVHLLSCKTEASRQLGGRGWFARQIQDPHTERVHQHASAAG